MNREEIRKIAEKGEGGLIHIEAEKYLKLLDAIDNLTKAKARGKFGFAWRLALIFAGTAAAIGAISIMVGICFGLAHWGYGWIVP